MRNSGARGLLRRLQVTVEAHGDQAQQRPPLPGRGDDAVVVPRQPVGGPVGTGHRQLVADLVGDLEDGLGAHAAVEVAVEDHLGQRADVQRGGRTHCPSIDERHVYTCICD